MNPRTYNQIIRQLCDELDAADAWLSFAILLNLAQAVVIVYLLYDKYTIH